MTKINKEEWQEMCEAFISKVGGGELLFANHENLDMGYEKDGFMYHLNFDEMVETLKNMEKEVK